MFCNASSRKSHSVIMSFMAFCIIASCCCFLAISCLIQVGLLLKRNVRFFSPPPPSWVKKCKAMYYSYWGNKLKLNLRITRKLHKFTSSNVKVFFVLSVKLTYKLINTKKLTKALTFLHI